MLLKHKETTKNHSLAHSSAMLHKSKKLRELQKLVVGMLDLMFDQAQEEAKRSKTLEKTIKAKYSTLATLTRDLRVTRSK